MPHSTTSHSSHAPAGPQHSRPAAPAAGFHPDRASGGDFDHRHAHWHASTGHSIGARVGPAFALLQQPAGRGRGHPRLSYREPLSAFDAPAGHCTCRCRIEWHDDRRKLGKHRGNHGGQQRHRRGAFVGSVSAAQSGSGAAVYNRLDPTQSWFSATPSKGYPVSNSVVVAMDVPTLHCPASTDPSRLDGDPAQNPWIRWPQRRTTQPSLRSNSARPTRAWSMRPVWE